YYFDENMLIRIENYRYIINNLDRAIREHWIQVYYQPIVRAKSGMICDEEALSRWIDPIKGFLSPGEFIPILEGARLIYKLDLYVLDQILLKMQRQQQEGLYVVPQSLNLSRMDFDSCDIIAEICQRMDQAGISRDKLTIEITESVVGSDFEFIRKQIQKLQELGFKVWMDDFGSGYSSLDVLQDIHFDLIKFDMRFMHRFGEGDESRIILTELIHMAIALGIDTLAEGVETKEQADFLRETGCTRLQGFYYSKAISLEEILKRSREKTLPAYENPDMTH
ncbi:MAG: EAL domain-containing protein, partial [Blautia sp.]|nr:EAL domain-containing protein [Blautia sp.]